VVKIWKTHTIRIGSYNEYYGNIQPSGGFAQGQITTAANNPTGSGNALADLLLGNVSSFQQVNFNPNQRVRSIIIEGYLQDSWKITRTLTVNYGLRIQHDPFGKDQNNIGHLVFLPDRWKNDPATYLPGFEWVGRYPTGVANEGYNTRAAYFAPRFGFAWDIFGAGKTVIRGGIGLYRSRGPITNAGGTVGLPQPTGSTTYTPPTAQGTKLATLDTLVVPFINGQNASVTAIPDNISSQLGMTWTDNFGISQKLPWNTVIEASYVNTLGRHINENFQNNINPVPYGAMLATPNASNLLFRRYANYQDLTISDWDAFSDYHSLQVTLQHRSSKYLISANYTLSKVTGSTAIGTIGANGVTFGDGLNSANDHGPMNFDRRHVANLAYSVDLPGLANGNRLLKGAANGWTVSGIMQIQSGANLQNAGNFGLTLPAGAGTQISITGTPDVAISPVLTCDPTKNLAAHQYLNPACFALPTPGHNGSMLIPEAFGPMFFNADASLFKSFKFSEKKNLQIRVEGFNFLNHPIWSFGFDNNLNLAFNSAGQQTNTSFGTTTTKAGHRIMQFVAKFYF
jgi:hypothetical protein